MRTDFPSSQPSSFSLVTKVERKDCGMGSFAAAFISTPMRRILPDCARADCGQPAAVHARPAMNSRRRMDRPASPARLASPAGPGERDIARSHLLVRVHDRLAIGAGLLQPIGGELLADLLEAGF